MQIRNKDKNLREMDHKINDKNSEICIHIERMFLDQLNASCKSPVSVYCHIKDNNLFLKSTNPDLMIPLVSFETKSKKTRESIIIKLLHKQENVAEELFDRIGVRFTKEKIPTDPITIFNNANMCPESVVRNGISLLEHVPMDYMWNKYGATYYSLIKKYNLEEGKILFAAYGQDRIIYSLSHLLKEMET